MADTGSTPGGSERRLRRVEPGDPALIRRAEEAETTVRTLEGHVAELRRGLREAEAEQRRTAEQLAQREHDVRRVKQREYAEQQLRVEAEEQRERLEREQRGELDRLQRRLAAGERHARELSDRLEIVRRELSEAEQAAATGRAAARRAELELAERDAELTRRELELEQQLAGVQRSHARMETIVRDLKALVVQLRSAKTPAAVAPLSLPVREEPNREEMASALAAAVARLRARVAPVVEPGEQEQPQIEQQTEPAPLAIPEMEPEAESAATPYTPRVLALTTQRHAWLAPAIKRVAERRDAKLAGELVCELLPAQRVKRALDYTLRIDGLGEVQARIEAERATVRRPSAGGGQAATARDRGDFLLEGSALAFAELAAGGAGRRLANVKVHGSRRKLRRLLAARRAPLALSDLLAAEVSVWPGLLLLALAEAIDPLWTKGHSFVLAFVVQGPPEATLYVQVRDGLPLAVTRVRSEEPLDTVQLSERAFLCMLAGAPLPPGEQLLLEGSAEPLELLLEWCDRAQGLAR
jgi:hypothetical protein